ncbi:MAG TPA: hypothetical protein VJP76_01140 [Candidatus Tumulicola sp.]|nr:hypothetical protein [Candidatus Tumulicola sp.]
MMAAFVKVKKRGDDWGKAVDHLRVQLNDGNRVNDAGFFVPWHPLQYDRYTTNISTAELTD